MKTMDPLTGLPNRLALERRLQYPDPGAARMALLVVDMDDFHAINGRHGRDGGDALLREAARRPQAATRNGDLVVRMEGDDFAVLAEVAEPDQVKVIARRVLRCLQAPFELGGRSVDLLPSIGIALDTAAGSRHARLIEQAGIALRLAKERGRNRHELYDAAMSRSATEIELLLEDIRQALERREFFLLYQPKLDIQRGRIVGVEALLRWKHPRHGVITPDNFIPLAEQTGAIVDIGRWVLDEACRQMRAWRDQGVADWSVAINTSVFEIGSPAFFRDICGALERYGLDPRDLTIEVTESGAMRNPELSLAVLRRLASLGVRVSLDDFGVGYSSLAHLRRLPVDEVKLDRSFIAGLTENAEDPAIVSAIITLAKAVSLRVVAEGVETLEQQATLAEMECDAIQGYLVSPPAGPDDIAAIASRYREAHRHFDEELAAAAPAASACRGRVNGS
ncbi:MAG: bifunctional diguanylate cyclase/phosphodiesterase [Gammaproteobacteria bacterium]